MSYVPPLDEIRFALDNIAGLPELASTISEFSHADADSVAGILEEYGRFLVDKVLETNRIGDEEGSRLEDGGVVTPTGFREAYNQYVEAGWGAVPFDPGFGGGGFPWVVGIAMQEILNSCNMSFAMAPLLTQGAIDLLDHHGSEEQRSLYLPKMVTGEWTGTMNLTEPDAGSDVGALRTKATPADDGTWRISGTKIFITFGDHDMAENIIHLVLARTPDAPPGTKGISCFVVPKFLVNEDGSLGDRNAAQVVSIEHKMGVKASPTCVMEYDNAIGYLIGEANAGMRYMFTMMNNARLSVGVEGLGLCEVAWQRARAYANERRQGRAPGKPAGESSLIVEHPDVRRMLMTIKSSTQALRFLHYFNARQLDIARHHPDAEEREAAGDLAELLTPLSKGWGTDLASELTSLAIQVHGGMGYIEETGVAQLYRDARITSIYEGTNGIQAMDLVGRKLPLKGGAVIAGFLSRIGASAAQLQGSGDDDGGDLKITGDRLAHALETAQQATEWIGTNGAADPTQALSAATPYLRLLSLLTGAWLLGVAALDAEGDDRRQRAATARFFAEHLLPAVHGLVGPITAGKDALFALSNEEL